MKEKILYTSFFAANLADTLTTKIGLEMNLSEASPFAASYIEMNYDDHYFIEKVGISAMLIGLAAIARSKNKDTSMDRVLNKTVQYSSFFVWGAVAINTAQIISQMQ